MQEKVAAYLEKRSHEKHLAEEKYRYLVLESAGLLGDSKEYMEISQAEYDACLKNQSGTTKFEDGRYYILKKPSVQMTDAEFAAVEKEIPEKTLNRMKREAFGRKKEKDWAVILLTAAACVIAVGGLVLALISSIVPTNWYIDDVMQYSFSFSGFLSVFLPYVLYSAVCLFLAEVCRKAAAALKLLGRK